MNRRTRFDKLIKPTTTQHKRRSKRNHGGPASSSITQQLRLDKNTVSVNAIEITKLAASLTAGTITSYTATELTTILDRTHESVHTLKVKMKNTLVLLSSVMVDGARDTAISLNKRTFNRITWLYQTLASLEHFESLIESWVGSLVSYRSMDTEDSGRPSAQGKS